MGFKNLLNKTKEAGVKLFVEFREDNGMTVKWKALKVMEKVVEAKVESVQSLRFEKDDSGMLVDLLTVKGLKISSVVKDLSLYKEGEVIHTKIGLKSPPKIGHKDKVLHVMLVMIKALFPVFKNINLSKVINEPGVKMDGDNLIYALPKKDFGFEEAIKDGEILNGVFLDEGLKVIYQDWLNKEEIITSAIKFFSSKK
ncbi:MAG: hypothetical protein WD025_02495 [Bacteriovoracaceae bacterium]